MSEISSPLNPSQRQAVEHQGRHLLIVAGPGTGKTHTLTQRVIYVFSKLRDGQKILAVTFTIKAAEEMRKRLEPQLGAAMERLFVGTFHQFCLSILREYADEANLPRDFQVADPNAVEAFVKELWPRASARERKNRLEAINLEKSNFGPSEAAEGEAYNRFLRAKGFLDFDDLLLEALRLLREDGSVRRRVQETFSFIFVDEYQDVNPVQHALLNVLVGEKGGLTAIGDPNQAIYGFRGCDVRYFHAFLQDFPGAGVFSLLENYRSGASLLEASAQVMAKGEFPVPNLTARIYWEGRLMIHAAPTEKAEAEYVVHQIEKLVGGTSMFSQDSKRVDADQDAQHSFGDFAVIYRLNAQRRILEEAFARSGIPFQYAGEQPPEADAGLSAGVEKVNLLTMHAAKGLEFPVVFVAGCEENLIPLKLEGISADLHEERRLFYVAMTRAKEKLYCTRARRRFLFGQKFENPVSPFLLDIEERLKDLDRETSLPKRPLRRQKDQQLTLFGQVLNFPSNIS